MRAVMLAAGVGRPSTDAALPPRLLLRLDGRSLLEYQLGLLFDLGVDEVVIGVGDGCAEVRGEIARLGHGRRVGTVYNPDYRQGNVVTLWRLRGHLDRGGPVLLLEADVLCERAVVERLLRSPHPSCLLLDRYLGPGRGAAKLGVRGGRPVEIGKTLHAAADLDGRGRAVGICRLSAAVASLLGRRAGEFVADGRRQASYQEALRELLLENGDAFGYEDVTGHAWIEIESPADVRRAEREVVPRIRAAARGGRC